MCVQDPLLVLFLRADRIRWVLGSSAPLSPEGPDTRFLRGWLFKILAIYSDRSEHEFQSELYVSSRKGLVKCAESRISQVRIGIEESGVIESVEEFGAEL